MWTPAAAAPVPLLVDAPRMVELARRGKGMMSSSSVVVSSPSIELDTLGCRREGVVDAPSRLLLRRVFTRDHPEADIPSSPSKLPRGVASSSREVGLTGERREVLSVLYPLESPRETSKLLGEPLFSLFSLDSNRVPSRAVLRKEPFLLRVRLCCWIAVANALPFGRGVGREPSPSSPSTSASFPELVSVVWLIRRNDSFAKRLPDKLRR